MHLQVSLPLRSGRIRPGRRDRYHQYVYYYYSHYYYCHGQSYYQDDANVSLSWVSSAPTSSYITRSSCCTSCLRIEWICNNQCEVSTRGVNHNTKKKRRKSFPSVCLRQELLSFFPILPSKTFVGLGSACLLFCPRHPAPQQVGSLSLVVNHSNLPLSQPS